MTAHWLEEAVRACKLPPAATFPRRMDKLWVLPVTVVRLPELTPQRVRDWFSQRKLEVGAPTFERELHGCMVAEEGKGFLFCDSTDPVDVQHFTLAHEVGHFVLEHLLPRARAVGALGKDILPVLNGQRQPSSQEAVSAFISQVPLGTLVRLMDRDSSGAIATGRIDIAEHRADLVAFELLAPAKHVLPRIRGLPRAKVNAVLESHFGLPARKARAYARILLGPKERGFSIREYLDEEEGDE
jgi:hypothetical protein